MIKTEKTVFYVDRQTAYIADLEPHVLKEVKAQAKPFGSFELGLFGRSSFWKSQIVVQWHDKFFGWQHRALPLGLFPKLEIENPEKVRHEYFKSKFKVEKDPDIVHRDRKNRNSRKGATVPGVSDVGEKTYSFNLTNFQTGHKYDSVSTYKAVKRFLSAHPNLEKMDLEELPITINGEKYQFKDKEGSYWGHDLQGALKVFEETLKWVAHDDWVKWELKEDGDLELKTSYGWYRTGVKIIREDV